MKKKKYLKSRGKISKRCKKYGGEGLVLYCFSELADSFKVLSSEF
jgi:hypothetical protein